MTTRLKSNALILVFSLVLFAMACSSRPIFKPEVEGRGVESSRGGVVYSIPPEHPVLKMKLVSLGITKENMLYLRMYFLRDGPPAGEYLDPKEQTIELPDSKIEIFPTRVHASESDKPLIRLSDKPKQAIEILFLVPKGGHEYPFINLHWKIHYAQGGQEKIMSRTERFDLIQKEPPQEGVGSYSGDLEFPYVGSVIVPEEWVTPGWLWW